jgi:ribose-phosphate pyrophosphokinase
MRQDKRFQPGEGTSARHMAELLSSCADWLATVDPHLHRLSDLESVFRIPALAVSSAAPLAQWIARHVRQPLIVGPDSESAQWVANVAGRLGCPFLVMEKQRSGDRMVTVSLNGASVPHGYTPVLLDDIASSGHTLARAVRALRASGTAPPVCAIVHGVFAGDALEVLHRAGPAQVVSCNTVLHPSNQVDITQALAEAAALLALGVRNREVAAS